MPDKAGNALTDPVPARVQAIADKIGDAPLAWNEKEDGSIVIVFNTKGKQTFEKVSEVEETFDHVIHTKAEAEEVVKTLPPRRKKGK